MDAKQSVSAQPAVPAETQPAETQPAEPQPAAAQLAEPRPARPVGRLRREARVAVGLAELAAVVALGLAVIWAWQRASIPYELPPSDNPAIPRSVQRWSGPWVGVAFGLAALAGVLVLDAVRQAVLTLRAPGPSRPESRSGSGRVIT